MKPLRIKSSLGVGVLFALLAAFSFGVTTPIVQKLGSGSGAFPIATLLYAGAAAASLLAFRSSQGTETRVSTVHLPRIAAIALIGAAVAPACLVWGLQRTSASAASLLLNFEAVFSVGLAWALYREPIGRRVAVAVALMAGGGVCLIVGDRSGGGFGWGTLFVLLATLAWALDNALSRPLADLNPTQVVLWKAIFGASLGMVASAAFGQRFPTGIAVLGLFACGATGYGLSLRFYLRAQRHIGAGRTASIFAVAPFVGAASAWVMGDRSANVMTLLAASLFGIGVWLHLTEVHRHEHSHDPIEHEHAHRHDDGHHDHVHELPVVGEHTHPHWHDATTHDHPHTPDTHHHHRHV